jgi:hypothetical protein
MTSVFKTKLVKIRGLKSDPYPRPSALICG